MNCDLAELLSDDLDWRESNLDATKDKLDSDRI